MDNRRFDTLAKMLAGTRSRRSVLGALVGGLAGAVAGRRDVAAVPCCGVCPPPCSCVCDGDASFCDCPVCEPTGCGGRCGVVDDGCGGTINCGCCPEGCNGRCGNVSDGCGGTIFCGPCEACAPRGCEGRGGIVDDGCGGTICCPIQVCYRECGIVDDGCGGTVDCGCCPISCDGQCGVVQDGCGNTEDCGPCEACAPRGCEGRCGAVDDGCGGILDCGCPPGQTCAGGQCAIVDQDGGSSDEPPETPPNAPTGTDQTSTTTNDPATGNRYVVLLDGFGSSSLLDDLTGRGYPENHGVRDRFAPLVEGLREADPTAQFVYFSYRAGPLIADGKDPRKGWTGQQFGAGREPVYRASNVTDRPLHDHVRGFDWVVGAIHELTPGATVDFVGFGLGGVVALAWVAERMRTSDEARVEQLDAVRRVVLVDSPIAGLNPNAVTSAAGVRDLRSLNFDPGNGALVGDLVENDDLVAALSTAADRVKAFSIENREDYLVNGEPIAGIGIWLGKGASGIVPEGRRFDVRCGTAEGNLLATHRLILESPGAATRQAHDHLVTLLA